MQGKSEKSQGRPLLGEGKDDFAGSISQGDGVIMIHNHIRRGTGSEGGEGESP